MSAEQPNPPAPTAEPSGGVLAALPRTRPQRASPRRAAARARAQSETAAPARTKAKPEAKPKPKTKPKTKPAKAKPAKAKPKTRAEPRAAARKPAKRQPAKPAQERAPRQGYEPEEEIELGNTVHPPGGAELIESLADILGELASSGAGAGGRLLKDALSIFRRP